MNIPTGVINAASFETEASYCDVVIQSYANPNSAFTASGDLDNYSITQDNASVVASASGLDIQITSANVAAHGQILSSYILSGDFDMEFKFVINNWPGASRGCQDDLYLGMEDGQGNLLYISRLEGYQWPGMVAVYLNRTGPENGQWKDHMASSKNVMTGSSGYLRITRTNDQVYFYYKNTVGAAWTQKTDGSKTYITFNGDDIKVAMGFRRWKTSWADANVPVQIKITDFVLNSGGGLSQKRFELDYAITEVAKGPDHLEKMLACFGGFLIYTNGQFKLKIDKAEASVYHFSEANIVAGSLTWNLITPLSELPSHLRVEFIDIGSSYRRNYAEASFDWFADSYGYKQEELSLLGVRNYYQAWRLANYYLRLKHYIRTACAFKTGAEGLLLDAGDVITISHAAPNWDRKEFRISRISIHNDDTVSLEATEYNPAVYEIPGTTPQGLGGSGGISPGKSYAVISRLLAYEHETLARIEITFSLPIESGSWAGVDLFKQIDGTGAWEFIGTAITPSLTALVETAIDTDDTTIKIYDIMETSTDILTSATFPFNIRIDEEIIQVGSYNQAAGEFRSCIRGMNGTEATSHTADTVILKYTFELFYWEYTKDLIGHTIQFRGISVDRNGVDLDPDNPVYSNTLTIEGKYFLPAPPDLLEIQGQGNNVKYSGGDLVIDWFQRDKDVDGYGNHGYGDDITGYGGDTFTGFETNWIRVFVDGNQVRETTTSGTSFTYTTAMNISDNGSLRKDLTLKVYQQVNNELGRPATLVTTPI